MNDVTRILRAIEQGDPLSLVSPRNLTPAQERQSVMADGDCGRRARQIAMTPRRIRAQGRNPAFCKVAREAAFLTLHRAAGILPIP
jgi:hypothetical protein